MSGSEDFSGSITASESSAGSPVASSAVSSENVIVGVIKVPKKSLSREEKDALKRRVGVFVPAQGPVAVTRSGRVVRQPKHFVARPADEDSDDDESVDSSELMDVAEGEAEDIQSEGEEDEDDDEYEYEEPMVADLKYTNMQEMYLNNFMPTTEMGGASKRQKLNETHQECVDKSGACVEQVEEEEDMVSRTMHIADPIKKEAFTIRRIGSMSAIHVGED